MAKTYFFSQKLMANNTQQTYELPDLRSLNILNYGSEDVFVEFENNINTESIVIPIRGSIQIVERLRDIRYKTNQNTSTMYIYGLKHEKS